jgi:hypothetical protein
MLIAPAVLLGWWWRGYRRARRSPTSVRPGLLHRKGPRLWPLIVGGLLVLLAFTWSFAPVDEDYQYSCDVRPLITLAAGLEDAAPAVCRDLARDEMTGVPLWSLVLGLPLLAWGDRGRRKAATPGRRAGGHTLLASGGRAARGHSGGGEVADEGPPLTGSGRMLTRADATLASFFLTSHASRAAGIAIVLVVGALFVIFPTPNVLVTTIGTVSMICGWTSGVRRVRAVTQLPHHDATLVTQRANKGGGGWDCLVDVTMEDRTVQRLPLHIEHARPSPRFSVALLPDGSLVRASRYEQLGWSLVMLGWGALMCGLGLSGVSLLDMAQSYGGG